MSNFDLNSYFITDAKTNFVLDSQGKIFLGNSGEPVQLGSAIVSGIAALIGVAVNVTSTAMTLQQQKDLIEAERRLLNLYSGVVDAIKDAYSGYNYHSMEMRQTIENMKAAIDERMKNLKLGVTFVSEEKRLGGLIQNGFAELKNNGFESGIKQSVTDVLRLADAKKKAGQTVEALKMVDNLQTMLDSYGLILGWGVDPATRQLKLFGIYPQSSIVESREVFNYENVLLMKQEEIEVFRRKGYLVPKKTAYKQDLYWTNQQATDQEKAYFAYRKNFASTFDLILETLGSIGAPSWVYRAFFLTKSNKGFMNDCQKADFSKYGMNTIGYNRSKSDFTIVQNFVNGYNKQTYEEMIKKLEIKTDPAAAVARIQKRISEIKTQIEYYNQQIIENENHPTRENHQKAGNAAGLQTARGKLRYELTELENELAFAQAVIVKEGGVIVDPVTGETAGTGTDTVIGTGKTPEQIEFEAGRAKQQQAMKAAAEAQRAGMDQKKSTINSEKTVSTVAVAAVAGVGAYLIAKG
jgi:hypothetical protein